MQRTKAEIAAEVVALKALKPVGPFARKTAETIEVQIDALEGGVDETAAEFGELSDEQQSAALDAMNWANGDSNRKPSEEFGDLVG